MVELYVYLNQDLRQTLKICFLVVLFVICLYIKLYLIKIENNFLFFNLMLQLVFREDKELNNNGVCENLKIKKV
jgi:hypothetical protein